MKQNVMNPLNPDRKYLLSPMPGACFVEQCYRNIRATQMPTANEVKAIRLKHRLLGTSVGELAGEYGFSNLTIQGFLTKI